MSCRTSTAPRARRATATGALRAMMLRSGSRGSVSSSASVGVPAQRRAELRGDVGLADDLEVVPAFGGVLQPQHPPRGGVDELHPPLVVDDQHAFDHAAEDRFHARAIGVEVGRAAADLADRVVQRARHGADLVGAVVARRLRQIARGVALRDRGNRAHPAAEEHRDASQASASAASRPAPNATSAIRRTAASWSAMLGERQRQAHLGEQRRVGIAHRHRDVEHVGRERRAVAARDAEALAARLLNLRPRRVVLERRAARSASSSESPTTVPSGATNVTRALTSRPSASASASSSAGVAALAMRQRLRPRRRASLTSDRSNHAVHGRRRTDHGHQRRRERAASAPARRRATVQRRGGCGNVTCDPGPSSL